MAKKLTYTPSIARVRLWLGRKLEGGFPAHAIPMDRLKCGYISQFYQKKDSECFKAGLARHSAGETM